MTLPPYGNDYDKRQRYETKELEKASQLVQGIDPGTIIDFEYGPERAPRVRRGLYLKTGLGIPSAYYSSANWPQGLIYVLVGERIESYCYDMILKIKAATK